MVTRLLFAAGAPPVVSVCDVMSNLAGLDGATVVVVGRLSGTDEGSWLSEECGFKVEIPAGKAPPSISLSYLVGEFAPPPLLPSDFRWDRRSINQKLAEVKRTTRLNRKSRERWYACYGRLETHLPYRARVGENQLELNGFGHLSGSPAQLVAPRDGYRKLK